MLWRKGMRLIPVIYNHNCAVPAWLISLLERNEG